MKLIPELLMLIGRISISSVFLISAFIKVIDYEPTAELMASKGMTNIPFYLYGAAAVEAVGGLFLFFGCKARIGAILLLVFIIPVTYTFHDFWILEGADRQLQMILFAKNLSIFGGLLYILSCGGGGCSIDAMLRRYQNE